MRPGATILFAVLLAALTGVAQADADEPPLQNGAYEVQVRLELPNVLSWTVAGSTATICIPESSPNGALPVLSRNNPLADCEASNVEREGPTLTFDILCEGRGAAWGKAVYRLMPDAFEGRIAMVMGGKNMTMTEVQSGRRIGSCASAGNAPG